VLAKRSALLLTGALTLAACATNPVTGEQDFVLMSEADEVKLGASYHTELLRQYREYDDPELSAYVERIGQTLAAESHRDYLEFHFTVLDSEEINAFALPGGYVYMTRGIMAYLNSEAELAGVLGHEIGHVTARHSVRQHSQSTVTGIVGGVLSAATGAGEGNIFDALGQALTSGYGRDHELEADRLGAQYLARTGYNPDNMIEVIGVLKDQEEYANAQAESEGLEPRGYHGVFSTHPRNDKRLKETIRAARTYSGESTRPDNREAYLARIDGMVFGPSPDQGVVRGNHFYHPVMGFAFTAPDDWHIRNFPHYVALLPESRDAFLQLDVRGVQGDGKPESELLAWLGTDSLEEGSELHGDFPAYTGMGFAQTPFGPRTTRFVAWVIKDQVFMLAGAVKDEQQRARYDQEFLNIAQSFRKLSAEEREKARGFHVVITAAQAGGYAEAAKGSPMVDAAAYLRLLNGDYPDGEAEIGQPIKEIR